MTHIQPLLAVNGKEGFELFVSSCNCYGFVVKYPQKGGMPNE